MTVFRDIIGFIAPRVVKHRWFIIIAALALAAFALPGIVRLRVTVDIQDYFLDDDPVIIGQRTYEALFGSGDFVGALVEADDVLDPEALAVIHRVGDRLSDAFPEAGDVASLTTLDGALTEGIRLEFDSTGRLADPARIPAFRRAVAASPLINGTLVSSDFSEAWILMPLDGLENPDAFDVGRRAWEALRSVETGPVGLIPAGMPVFAYRKQVELMDDLLRVLAAGGLVAVILASLILRRFAAAFGTLTVFVMSVLSVLGVQGWIGRSVDSGFVAVPILLTMGVSIGYSVHVHRFVLLARQAGEEPKAAVVRALEQTIRPIFFTAATTVAALLSFLFVDVRPVRWVGATSAFCIIAAFAGSIVLFPAILALGPDRSTRKADSTPPGPRLPFARLGRVLEAAPRGILALFILIGSVAVVGLFRLDVDFDAVRMMGTRLPHMADQVRIGESSVGVGEFMNVVVTPEAGEFSEAETVRRLDELEGLIRTLDGVRRVRSITLVLREVNSLLHRRDGAYAGLPENPVSLRALIRLVDGVLPRERNAWLDETGRSARILVEVSAFSSKTIEGILQDIESQARAVFPDGVDLAFSGSTYQMARMNQHITRGLVRSILIAVVTIGVIMILVFRSLRWGLIAMIPNVFPVLVAGGILGFSGIPLEFVTMTVAPIVLGLAVDDTIHFMVFLRDDLEHTSSFRTSLIRAYHAVGIAISQTTLILCCSFLVFLISRITSIRMMGIIAASGMAAAYLADILVTPVMVLLGRRRDRSD